MFGVTLLFAWTFSTNIERRVRTLVEVKAVLAGDLIEALLAEHSQIVDQMAVRWQVRGGTPEVEWKADANQIAHEDSGYFALVWADAEQQVQWLVPEARDPAAIQGLLDGVPFAESGWESQSLELPDQSYGMVSAAPLYGTDGFDGFIAELASFEQLFAEVLPAELGSEVSLALVDGSDLLYGDQPGGDLYRDWMVEHPIAVGSSVWQVQVWPKQALITASGLDLPKYALAASSLASLLLGLTVYFAQQNTFHARMMETKAIERSGELRQAMVALRKSENEYEQLYESAPDMFFSVDPKTGTVVQCNQTLADRLGYPKRAILGKRVWDLYHPDYWKAGKEAFQTFLEKGELKDIELQLVTSDSSTVDVLMNASAIRDETGEVIYRSSIWRDVTEIKRAEREHDRLLIAEREQRRVAETLGRVGLALSATLEFESLVELICKESVNLYNVESAFVWLVEGDKLVGAAGYGPGRDEFIGTEVPLNNRETLACQIIRERRPIYVNNIEDSSQVNRDLAKMFNVHSILGVPLLKGIRPIGSLIILDTESDERFGPEDLEIASVLGSHVAVAVENARLYEQERQVAQMKDDFVAHVSHELRTPIHTLGGFIELLRSGRVRSADRRQELLERATHDVERLTEQVNELLDAARIEAVGVQLRLEETDLAAVLEQTVDSLRLMASDRGVDLRLNIRQAPLLISSETRRLRQIVRNLVENAIQYSQSGSEVWVGAEQADGVIEFTVADEGPGISEQAQERLFDRFYQVGNQARREKGGVGLGLYITKTIIDAHEGRIEVDSRVGHGTTFRVTLPVGVVEATDLELA